MSTLKVRLRHQDEAIQYLGIDNANECIAFTRDKAFTSQRRVGNNWRLALVVPPELDCGDEWEDMASYAFEGDWVVHRPRYGTFNVYTEDQFTRIFEIVE